MNRELLSELKIWKNKKNRLPLILKGARQVGKTWLLKKFGEECFNDVCYINFEKHAFVKEIFEGSISPMQVIETLSVFHGKPILSDKTLLIFDEIQEVPRALTALKYFAEETPEYFICCAGSLLGIALHKDTSFPVGKVDFLTLQPLSFKEFLSANNENSLIDYIITKGLTDNLNVFSEKLTVYLKQYFIVGGMPAAVADWLDTRDFYSVEKIQHNILTTYDNDFSKHAPSTMIAKLRHVWNNLPRQLAKENRKFVYGLVREGARAREYEETLMWLTDAGLIRRVFHVEKPALPLKFYSDNKNFKIYLIDVGLLRVMSELSPKTILEGSRIFEEFKGALSEQFVLQELQNIAAIQACYYWTSDFKAEVDFIFSTNNEVYPLEVKSGQSVHSKSLNVFIEKYKPALALRASLLPLKRDGSILNISFYALFNIENYLDNPN
jgi:predicted AAA+ superfamily ATPase